MKDKLYTLKELREVTDIARSRVEKDLYIKCQALYKYENDLCIVPYKKAVLLAEYYGQDIYDIKWWKDYIKLKLKNTDKSLNTPSISELIKTKNISLEELSRHTGLTNLVLKSIEKGTYQRMSVKDAMYIANYFNLNVGDILW